MRFGKLLVMVVLGIMVGSSLLWGLPPGEERRGRPRQVVRILLSEVQVGEAMVKGVELRLLRFAGDGQQGPAVLVGGSGKMQVAGKEDRVLLSADTASSLAGQWRKLREGEVVQVPAKVVIQGEVISGALVIWQRGSRQDVRFVVDRHDGPMRELGMAESLVAAEPSMPVSEIVIDYFADANFSQWVGSFIRLCDGATAREGIQDGFSKAETTTSCDVNNPWTREECWQYIGWDENGDGTPEQFIWFQVNCPPRFPW